MTVDLDATTAGATRSWAVSAFDLSGYLDHEQYAEVTLDKSTVAPGESVKLSIKARKMNPKQREIIAVVSTLGVHSHMWPLLVMMR